MVIIANVEIFIEIFIARYPIALLRLLNLLLNDAFCANIEVSILENFLTSSIVGTRPDSSLGYFP